MYSLLPLMLSSSEAEEEVEHIKEHSGPDDDLEFLNPMQNTALPFNKYAWLTTHNSHAIFGSPPEAGSPIITFFNQEDSVTAQLNVSFRTHVLHHWGLFPQGSKKSQCDYKKVVIKSALKSR